jgi:hypothetical protein
MRVQLSKWLTEPRQCRADWLMIHARKLAVAAKQANSATLLVYSCLETRNAIEQLCFEILLVVQSNEIRKEDFFKWRKRKDGFLAAIHELEPKYRLLSQFSAIVMEVDRKVPYRGIAWDLKKLKKNSHAISEYCHAQGDSVSTLESEEWIETGYKLVEETYEYFHSQMAGGATVIMPPEKMSYNTRLIWEDFLSQSIDEEQVRVRLRNIQ